MAHDAAYFRAQADRAQADADAAQLDNVRDRALRSVAAFEAMAISAERTTQRRIAREEATAAARVPLEAAE
ncbi:hypothetical protein [uncultured Sphingomonas sp.]|uniref:hypothetical protein n=1 Tax=uncultured Sphingomonas sp. TaxID=158754 RepID=UPI0025D095AB|nr:hypothetical protein [uncultured Sphingomonas sp.]